MWTKCEGDFTICCQILFKTTYTCRDLNLHFQQGRRGGGGGGGGRSKKLTQNHPFTTSHLTERNSSSLNVKTGSQINRNHQKLKGLFLVSWENYNPPPPLRMKRGEGSPHDLFTTKAQVCTSSIFQQIVLKVVYFQFFSHLMNRSPLPLCFSINQP